VVTKEDALPYATNSNNLLLRIADMTEGGTVATAPKPKPKPAESESMLDIIER
jgi:hypothetical protein